MPCLSTLKLLEQSQLLASSLEVPHEGYIGMLLLETWPERPESQLEDLFLAGELGSLDAVQLLSPANCGNGAAVTDETEGVDLARASGLKL